MYILISEKTAIKDTLRRFGDSFCEIDHFSKRQVLCEIFLIPQKRVETISGFKFPNAAAKTPRNSKKGLTTSYII